MTMWRSSKFDENRNSNSNPFGSVPILLIEKHFFVVGNAKNRISSVDYIEKLFASDCTWCIKRTNSNKNNNMWRKQQWLLWTLTHNNPCWRTKCAKAFNWSVSHIIPSNRISFHEFHLFLIRPICCHFLHQFVFLFYAMYVTSKPILYLENRLDGWQEQSRHTFSPILMSVDVILVSPYIYSGNGAINSNESILHSCVG